MPQQANKMAPKAPNIFLLDVNVLIALAWPSHVHHEAAHVWFEETGKPAWASCPLTQLAFVRISSNPKIIPSAVSPRAAVNLLTEMTTLPGHIFFADVLQLSALITFTSKSFIGHRQTTDAYLLALAMHNKCRLATLDQGVGDLLPEAKRSGVIALILGH